MPDRQLFVARSSNGRYWCGNTPCTQYGVLWRLKLVPGDAVQEEYTEYSGYWYEDIAPALKELDRAAANPRCADARVFMRRTEYRELTKNAVEWLKEANNEHV